MVSTQNLVRTYHSGEVPVYALKGVSLDIDGGAFVSIAGPSGSGKTTLLNLIGCLDKPDGGDVTVDGAKVSTMDRDDLAEFRREKLGFVFQTFNLIPVLTAYENVSFALSLLRLSDQEVKERSMKMLEEVGLSGMENRLPLKLSGGQQQRVAIARALVKQPRIVLADEPTANLDSDTGQSILNLMEEMNSRYDTTFVFSTHDKMVMDHAHRLVMLHDGKIVSDERR
jgi:putative ABC transport system ATP-binding protein